MQMQLHRKGSMFEVHIWYLTALVLRGNLFRKQLRELKLLNRRGRWKAVEAFALTPMVLMTLTYLNRRHADILASRYGHQDFPAESLFRRRASW